ncbi:MAG: MerR family transcriptional regulator [Bacteroidales bacterium]|nr:MerR family transcriptional regulator [Bacteroidales bacterium]
MPYKEKKVEKLFYSIGEASEIIGVPVSTIRFWENEFDILRPHRNKKGNRQFTPVDMENLKKIHFLLKERGMTIDGAKKVFSAKTTETDQIIEVTDRLKGIRSMLKDLIESI